MVGEREEGVHRGDALSLEPRVLRLDQIGEVTRQALAGAIRFGARTDEDLILQGDGHVCHSGH
ncbi:MAG: hypothetical protein JNJ73_15655 [Hyphomonadaceae bacterium]|nr:hypothetical protein [Hyphomonadaceae bacterium]